jgi:methyltransferase family protein
VLSVGIVGHRHLSHNEFDTISYRGGWMSHALDRACPLCGAASSFAAPTPYGSDEWPVVRCRECDLVYIGRTPIQAEFEEERAWEKSSVRETVRRARDHGVLFALDRLTRARFRLAYRRRPKAMVARLAQPGPVLDLGCGDGKCLSPPPPGFTPFGVEVSKGLAAVADAAFRPFGGRCIRAPAAEGLSTFPPKYFKAALMLGYLEHEFHPLEILAQVRSLLADDAVVIAKMPNFACINRHVTGHKWCGFRLPDHVNYYTPRTLTELARRAGFEVSFGLLGRQPLSDNMWALLRPARVAQAAQRASGDAADRKRSSAKEPLTVQ